MRVRCDCYMAWSNYACLPGYVAADASLAGFWMKTKTPRAFAALAGAPAPADFDPTRDHAVVVGREKKDGKIVSFAEEQDYYPYSGQWNGYSPFSFLEKEVEFDASELEMFLDDAEKAIQGKDWALLFEKYARKPGEQVAGNSNKFCAML